MKRKAWMSTRSGKATPILGVLALAALGAGGPANAIAGSPPNLPTHFSGLLSDYTPLTSNGVAIKGAPYEMHGRWTLDLNYARTRATFSAAIAMETAESANPDPNLDPGALGAHTHHLTVSDGVVHNGPEDWVTLCPQFKPSPTGGFAVTGNAYITGNGVNAPFGNPSPVTICILGGMNTMVPNSAYATFANFTLSIEPPASSHFGPQPIHGVVTRCSNAWGGNQQACEATVVP